MLNREEWQTHLTQNDIIKTAEKEQILKEAESRRLRISTYKRLWFEEDKKKNPEKYRIHKEKAAAYMRKWRAENRGLAREISRKGSAKYNIENPASRRSQAIAYNCKMRTVIITFFGGKCIRCGFDDPRALQMDHINGGGLTARKKYGETLFDRYKLVVEQPELARTVFQLLCANCNCIKRDENYEYGHHTRAVKAAQE